MQKKSAKSVGITEKYQKIFYSFAISKLFIGGMPDFIFVFVLI